MKSKSTVRFMLGGLVLVAMLSLLLIGCQAGNAPSPQSSPQPSPPALSPAPAPQQGTPAPAPAPPQPAPSPTGTQLKLTVVQPEDNTIIDANKIEVKGATSPGAVVTVNNEITTADSQGNFAVTIILDEGPNIVEVLASDESGNEASLTLTVSYIKGG